VLTLKAVGVDHPALARTFRTEAEIEARLSEALTDRPYLLGDRFTAADLLLHSPYAWFGKPGRPVIDAWVERCMDRPGARFAAEFDARHPAD
jgi:glutathione S-transferase